MIAKVWNAMDNLIESRGFAALLHVPILGAFACMLSGVLLVKRRHVLRDDVRLGVGAQIAFPLVFLLGSAVRYVFWFLGFEIVNTVLFYIVSAYMVAAYIAMLLTAYGIFTGTGFRYGPLQNRIMGFAEWAFGQ